MDEHEKARLKSAQLLYESALRKIHRAQEHLEKTKRTGLITVAKELSIKTESLAWTIKWHIGNNGGENK